MYEKIKQVLKRLKFTYPINESYSENEITFTVEGIDDTFHLVITHECTLYTDYWHEHFSSSEDFENFLYMLFKGVISVILKFRGQKYVGHRTTLIEDGKTNTMSFSGLIFSPFWKKKSYKTLCYKVDKKQ